MNEIWDEVSKGKSDVEKLKIIRRLREGMAWGSREQGIPQLSETELFLLKLIDDLEKRR